MLTASILAGVSAVGLVLLALLFHREDRLEQRYLSAVRTLCDRGLLWLFGHIRRVSYWLGAGNVRLFLHAFLHRVYYVLLYILRKGEGFIERRARRNRRHAKAVSRSLNTAEHLQQLADHQASTALDEEERKRRRSFET